MAERESPDRKSPRAYDVVACPQCEAPAKKYPDGPSFRNMPSFKIVCDADPRHQWRQVGHTPSPRHK